MEAAKFTFRDRLPVLALTPLPNHPRNHPDENSEAALKDLRWIKANALKTSMIDPVTVVKVNERTTYVIDGVRRLRVAELLGMNYINCIVYNGISEAEAAHLSYRLNTIHPSDPLTTTEKAHHLKMMKDEFAYSYSDLEEMGYGSKSEILNAISTTEPETQSLNIETTESDVLSAGDERENQLLKNNIPLIHHVWQLALAGIKIPIFPHREGNFEIPFYHTNPKTNIFHNQEINLLEKKTQQLELIAVETLTKDPNHPRQKSGDLESLIKSLRHDGLMTPISVAKVGDDKYHVIDGWRRIEASKEMGMVKISCLVCEDLKEADA